MIGFKFKNNNKEIKCKIQVFKNLKEPLGELTSNCIDNITLTYKDISQLNFHISQFRKDRKGNVVENRLFNIIKPRHLIKLRLDNQEYLFTIKNKSQIINADNPYINFTAISNDIMFRNIKCYEEIENPKELYNGKDGYLDLISTLSGYKIGTVDEECKLTTIDIIKKYYMDIATVSKTVNIKEKFLLFEKDLNIVAYKDKPLYLQFDYTKLVVNSNELTPISTEIQNSFYGTVKKVKGYVISNSDLSRIIYEFEVLNAKNEIDLITVDGGYDLSVNCLNKSISFKVDLTYNFRELEEDVRVTNYSILNLYNKDLDTLLREIENNFNGVTVIDTYNNVINFYSYETVNNNEGQLILSLKSNLDSITTDEEEDIVTCMKLSSDLLQEQIEYENLTGEFVYNYNYFIENDIISDKLKVKLDRYNSLLATSLISQNNLKNNIKVSDDKIKSLDGEVSGASTVLFELQDNLADKVKDVSDSQKKLDEEKRELDDLKKDKDSTAEEITRQQQKVTEEETKKTTLETELADIKKKIEETQTRINDLLNKLMNETNVFDDLSVELIELKKSIKKENATDLQGVIFDNEDILELNTYTYTEEFNDTSSLSAKRILDKANEYLQDKQTPLTEISTSINNINVSNPRGVIATLKLGSLFFIEEMGNSKVRLIQIQLTNINDTLKVSNLMFTNKLYKIDLLSNLENLSLSNNKQVKTNKRYSSIWDESIKTNTYVTDILNHGLNVATTRVNGASDRNKISCTGAGIFVSDKIEENKKVYIGSDLIAISVDGFKTSSLALDSSGIYAKHLVGEIVMGKTLKAVSELGSFEINGNGLEVYDPTTKKLRIRLGIYDDNKTGILNAILALYDKEGNEALLTDEGISSEQSESANDNVDVNSPLFCHLRLLDSCNKVKKAILYIKPQEFLVYNKGVISAPSKTSSSNGGYSNTITSTQQTNGGGTFINLEGITSEAESPTNEPLELRTHIHHLTTEDHWHNIKISIPQHYHTTPAHTHDDEYGCFYLAAATPSDMHVYINDTKVTSNPLNGASELDITNYLEVNRLNEIKITSASMGRIYTHCYCKSFNKW